jgi:hypothetical protein
MSDLLLLIRDLCLRKRGPQDMPYSLRLLLIFIGLSLLLDLIVASMLGDVENTLAHFLLVTSFKLIALNIVLSLRDLRSRFVQTASALIACGIVFELIALPLKSAINGILPTTPPQDVTPVQMLAMWLTLGIFVWKVMVDANILRQALNLPALGAYLLVLLGIFAEAALLISVFGDTL